MLIFAAYSGAGWGEIAALTIEDINLESIRARIHKTIVRVNNKDVLQAWPKTKAGNHYVPLSIEIIDIIHSRVSNAKRKPPSYFLRQGVPLPAVLKIMGQSSPNMTATV